jgi:hypothetical protein
MVTGCVLLKLRGTEGGYVDTLLLTTFPPNYGILGTGIRGVISSESLALVS